MAVTINASTSAGLVQTADTSGVLALQTAGTTALTVDTSQNVGIGTASPTYKLSVNSSVGINSYDGVSGKGRVVLGDPLDNTGYVGMYRSLASTIGTAGNDLTLGALATIAFTTGAAGFASQTERMRIDSSGNVGIGTASPVNLGAGITTLTTNGTTQSGAIFQVGGVNTGFIYSNASDSGLGTLTATPYKFTTNGSERMRIDSSGNVGIGTSSPNANLHLGAGGASFRIGITASNQYGELYRDGATGNIVLNAAQASFGNLVFQTTSTERMRIDTSGNLLVGVTSPAAGERLNVTGSNNSFVARFINANAAPYGYFVNYSTVSPNGTGNQFTDFYDSTALRLQVRSNGGIANYSANNVNLSDRREKTNITPAGDYLAKICAIPVQTFNYIDQNLEEDGGLTLGVIAQDVEAVAPELVMESNWAGKDQEPKMRLSIYQTDLQYALMKCIQEQQALITQLQADVAALKENK